MDGIDRYFQPNTLDGLSIYDAPDALLVDGSNAMEADADMGGHNVKNVATAVNADEAVNLGQFNAALAGKADDTLVVHQALSETITGQKTFSIVPLSTADATTGNGLVRLSQMSTALAVKADLTYVNTQLATKADTSYVNTQLALKADTSYVNTQLALKANDNAVVHLANAETIEGLKTFNVVPAATADATSGNGLIRLSQLNTAIAGKADDSLVVHKANAETITGIKTFNALPETVLTPTTDSQLINRGTALSYIPYSDIGYVSYYDQSNATRPLSYGLYLTGTVPHGTNGLRMAAYSRNNLYGATVMLHARHYYNYIMLRWEQTLQNTYVTIGIYDGNGILVSSTLTTQLAKLGSGTGDFNGAIALQTPFQPTLTGCYVIVLHLSSATSSNNFLEAEACNSDILSNLLGTAGCTQRYLQKGWYYVLNSSTWTPPSSLASYNSGIVTSSKCLWLGLLYSVVAPP